MVNMLYMLTHLCTDKKLLPRSKNFEGKVTFLADVIWLDFI